MKKIFRWMNLFLIATILIQATTFAGEIYESPEVYSPREILVNQLGYYSKLSKTAIIKVTEGQNAPISFTVTNQDNDVVFFGSTSDYRSDADSGFYTQSIDFSLLKTPGDYLINCNNTTAQICIKDSLFEDCSDDALNYFYQNRSGLHIKSEYITSGNPALLTRVADEQFDEGYIQSQWKNNYASDGSDIETSNGVVNATGGWLDGDDMASKTVVAGAYTAWRLQNIYEIFRMLGIEDNYADGTHSLPEVGNSFPDLLDEARCELEYLLKLVAKSGTYKGMLYSGICDYKPLELPIRPEEDNLYRIVKPVSVVATLNATAVFAQGYRLWKDIDSSFANDILSAAQAAYRSAKYYSNISAPIDQMLYGDDNYSDNFYWAACELYSATGDSTFYSDMDSLHKFQFKTPDSPIAFTVADTAALGSISLLLNWDKIDDNDSSTLKTNLETTANSCIELMKNQSFGQPYSQEEVSESTTGYKWNSNESILNNVFLIQCASLLCEKIYFVGCAASGMDYIFGKNPLDISYVTGYGTHCVQNICHPYWGNPVNSSFPASPNGVMALGPCSSFDNLSEILETDVDDVPPALMYADNYQAYDVNRSSITANGALFATSTLMEFLYNDYCDGNNNNNYDDSYTISIDAVSNNTATIYSPNQFKATLIFAAYDANNRLEKIDIQNNATIAAGPHTYYASESFDDIDGLKVKVMLWENMTNIIPICKSN